MGTAERRNAIMKLLCRRRHETVHNLAAEFGVSERTIRRDIEALSYTEPIYTQTGRYCGGVYVVEGYSIDRMYMAQGELQVLDKLLSYTNRHRGILSGSERSTLKNIIASYAKPNCGHSLSE